MAVGLKNRRITLRATAIFVVLWLAAGFAIVLLEGQWPKTLAQWILWCAAAPILYLLAELLFEGLFQLLSRIPPIPWAIRWVNSGQDSWDRIVRVLALAAAFLVLFFIALFIAIRIIAGPE